MFLNKSMLPFLAYPAIVPFPLLASSPLMAQVQVSSYPLEARTPTSTHGVCLCCVAVLPTDLDLRENELCLYSHLDCVITGSQI